MTSNDFLARARSQLNHELKYRLGGGKTVPRGEHCGDEVMTADCSAFVCWCAKMRKYQADEFWWLKALNGGWLNTDGIWVDAVLHSSGNFEMSPKAPGAVVVYPGRGIEGSKSKSKYGHIGIVTELEDDGGFSAIHCSSGNHRIHGRAVRETGGEVFQRNHAIFVRPASVEP